MWQLAGHWPSNAVPLPDRLIGRAVAHSETIHKRGSGKLVAGPPGRMAQRGRCDA